MKLFKIIFCFCCFSNIAMAEKAVVQTTEKKAVVQTAKKIEVKKAVAKTAEKSEVKKAVAKTAEKSEVKKAVAKTAEKIEVKKAVAKTAEKSEVKKAVAKTTEKLEVKKAVAKTTEKPEIKKAVAKTTETPAVKPAVAQTAVEAVSGQAVSPTLTSDVVSSDHPTVTDSKSKNFWFVEYPTVELGFEYPLNFGVHLKYYLTESVYSRLGVSFMAEFFLGSFAKLSPYLGYLNNHEASVISHVFENSFYTDLRLGWFPYAKSNEGGPYVELGVSGMLFGRGQVSGFTLSKALGLEDLDDTGHYSLKTNAYNGTVHVGYQIPFERLKINVEAGLVKIFHTQLRPANVIGAPNHLNEEQKEKFQTFLKKKGWIFPTISGWVGVTF